MSYTLIEDGKGTGVKAEVKPNNKLAVEAISASRAAYIADVNEKSFMFATGGFISLSTTGVNNGIFYLKYTGEGHLHIDSIRACGTGVQKWLLYKDVTTGTLVSTATAASVNNTKLDSSAVLSYTAYKGADGLTVTDGTIIENFINNGGHSTEIFDGTLILGKNDSIAMTCEVTASIDVCVRILAFEDAGTVL